MILVDHQIRGAVEKGRIGITNFAPECLQPASYDLRIGPLVYSPLKENPDKPINLSANGGTFVLAPYGTAILMTFETLKLDKDVIGRFGLKSGFARRGLLASTGPQVDPGYKGKLFISLQNLVPRSQVLTYKETFLTIEFHGLDTPPENTYSGPYQSMEDVGPEILEDLVRLEGLNLSQIQNQFTELTHHVQEWSSLASRFNDFIEGLNNHTKAISELANKLTTTIDKIDKPAKTIRVRKLSLPQAKKKIIELLKKKGDEELYYSDVADELQLDYAVVIEACKQLENEDVIEEVTNVKKSSKRSSKKSS